MGSRNRDALRLLGALDTLYDREAAQIAARDARGLADTQERSRSVVEGLRALGPALADAETRALAERVLAKRLANGERIGGRVAEIRGELSETRVRSRTLSLLAPAYLGASRGGSRVFAARG